MGWFLLFLASVLGTVSGLLTAFLKTRKSDLKEQDLGKRISLHDLTLGGWIGATIIFCSGLLGLFQVYQKYGEAKDKESQSKINEERYKTDLKTKEDIISGLGATKKDVETEAQNNKLAFVRASSELQASRAENQQLHGDLSREVDEQSKLNSDLLNERVNQLRGENTELRAQLANSFELLHLTTLGHAVENIRAQVALRTNVPFKLRLLYDSKDLRQLIQDLLIRRALSNSAPAVVGHIDVDFLTVSFATSEGHHYVPSGRWEAMWNLGIYEPSADSGPIENTDDAGLPVLKAIGAIEGSVLEFSTGVGIRDSDEGNYVLLLESLLRTKVTAASLYSGQRVGDVVVKITLPSDPSTGEADYVVLKQYWDQTFKDATLQYQIDPKSDLCMQTQLQMSSAHDSKVAILGFKAKGAPKLQKCEWAWYMFF